MKIDKNGLIIGVIGCIGLGFLLGSEFSGRNATILGGILVLISLAFMGIFLYKEKN